MPIKSSNSNRSLLTANSLAIELMRYKSWVAKTDFKTNDGAVAIMSDQEGDNSTHIAFITCQANFKRGTGWQAECAERDANAARIVQCVNGWDALKQSHDELVVALQGLLERFVGANQIAKQPPSDFADYVRNLITKAKEVTK